MVNQAVESAQNPSIAAAVQGRMTVAVADRVGNVLAVYRIGAASEVTIRSGLSVTGGLEGVNSIASGLDLAALAAISKAVTGAYVSTSGNAFSTRTASYLIQKHLPPGIRNVPSGPLFGLQFSQLQCSDLVNTSDGASVGVGPRPSPLGVAADPGGFPLYKGGVVVGGIGVVAGATSTYGLDLDPDPRRLDFDVEEIIAQSATTGFTAPAAIRGDRITVGGATLRYSDSDARLVGPLASTTGAPIPDPPAEQVSVDNFFVSPVPLDGTRYGEPASGFVADEGSVYPGTGSLGLFILVDALGNPRQGLPLDGAPVSGQNLSVDDVKALMRSSFNVARVARAQLRKPDGSFARVSVSIVDADGRVLAIARSPDAPVLGTDVSLQKARSAVFFSRNTASQNLNLLFPPISGGDSRYVRDTRAFFGNTNPNALANGLAISGRALGNIARPNFPDGVDGKPRGPLSNGINWSPFNQGVQFDLISNKLLAYGAERCTTLLSGENTSLGIDNGIQIRPASVPIYKNGVLVGGIGASGDGIEQEELVIALGLARIGIPGIGHAPASRRVKGLKYIQCPQAPFINSKVNNVCRGI